jgi:DNA-binding CsgD family transcriptional regulator
MFRSQRPSLSELRRSLHLLSECRDAGGDPSAWRLLLLEGLRGLVGAQLGISSEMRGFARGQRTEILAAVRTGWSSPDAERAWYSYVDEVPLERTPEYGPLTAAKGEVITRSRRQIWSDADWYRSRTFNERHKPTGVDDYIISIHHVPDRGISSSLWVHRAVGDRPFTRRERALLQIIHETVAPSIGTHLASASQPSAAELSPRRREVLARLLTGDSEKQIAAALSISPATAHEHVMAVYRHFQVRSRGELMALFVRRTHLG